MEWVVFSVFAVAALAGAGGVVLSRKPVHAALSLVLTLFSVAVFFVLQGAHFLAAVQVIVYAGAIVVLFLFVIMLLGVERTDSLEQDPLPGQRPAAIVAGLVIGAGLVAVVVTSSITGGRGDYAMEFARYEEVPAHLAQKVIAAAQEESEAVKA